MTPRRIATLSTLLLLAVSAGEAQDTSTAPAFAALKGRALPFAAGERIEFAVEVARVGASGKAHMAVEGPVDVRGTQALRLHFDFRAALGPFAASDCTISWIDPVRLISLRFHKKERHLVARGNDSVELFPDEGRWERSSSAGETPTLDPLDELAFIYFLRTLDFGGDSIVEFGRHYETERNPVRVRLLGRDTIVTAIGTIPIVRLEMRVRDPRRYRGGEGVIRLDLSDDARRIPVRMESEMPLVGRAVMTISSLSTGAGSGNP